MIVTFKNGLYELPSSQLSVWLFSISRLVISQIGKFEKKINHTPPESVGNRVLSLFSVKVTEILIIFDA